MYWFENVKKIGYDVTNFIELSYGLMHSIPFTAGLK